MTYHILYNPLSANGSGEEKAKSLSSVYTDTVYHDVTKIDDYAAFFAALPADEPLVLCGGDGTLNCFINNIEGIEPDREILYFASGTGNDFLHDLPGQSGETPFPINEYIKDLPTVTVKGKTYRFLNNVGFGIDGYCCEVGDELRKSSDKPVNYTSIAIKGLLFHYKPTNAKITVDGKEYSFKKVWLAPTMKGRFYGGGMMATPEQDRKNPDGTLSVMLFHGKGRLQTLIAFPSIFKGEHVKKTKMVTVLTGKDIKVEFDSPAAVQVDGETVLGVTEYTATARVKATV